MAKKTSLTDEQIKEYRECFNLFDKDGDNTISTAELLTVMKSLGHNPSTEEVTAMIEEVDTNGNGKIEFSEFLALMEKQLNNFESESLIRQAFEVIDYEGLGYITLKQLRHVVHDLGLTFTDEEMSDMIDEADPSGDGRVSYQGVRELFMDSHVTLSKEARKRWEFLKKRPIQKKKPPLRRLNSEKTQLKRLPGKRIPRKEKTNRDRFSRLSLSSEKIPYKPVVKRQTQSEQDYHKADSDRNTTTSAFSEPQDRASSRSTPLNPGAVKKLFALTAAEIRDPKSSNKAVKQRGEKKKTNENSGNVVKFLHKKLSSIGRDDVVRNSDRDTDMKTKTQSGGQASPGRGSRGGTNSRDKGKRDRDRELDLYEMNEDNMENDTSLPPITDRSYDGAPSPPTSRRLPVHERLYDPDYKKHRTSHAEPEPVYNRDFKARLPKHLENVNSKYMDPLYFEPKPEYELDYDETPRFRAYIPKQLEHVNSKILDPRYYEPRGEYVLDVEEPHSFRARLPKNMEHVQSRHLNQEYFQKRSSPDPALYDPHYNKFTARVPKGMEHVESRILDDKYFAPKSYEKKEETFDTEFKAHVPKYLEHIPVEKKLYYPKKPKAEPKDDAEVFQTEFKAKPPKSLEHVESRILHPSYFEPKPSYVEEEEDLNTEFKAKLPRSLQHVETRIYDNRYFQRKEPRPTTEDREVENMHTDFKAKLPKGLQHVKSKALDQAIAKSPSRMSDTSVLEMKTKGPVVLIKVKKDTNDRPLPSTGYIDRLHAEKNKDKDHYYKQWRKEFEDQVRVVRGDNKILGEKVEFAETGVRVPAKTSNKHSNSAHAKLQAPFSPRKEDDKEEKKERKPWRPPRRPKPEVVNRDFFDSWVMTETHIYRDPNNVFLDNRRNVSEMWNDLATSIDKAPVSSRRIRSVDKQMHY